MAETYQDTETSKIFKRNTLQCERKRMLEKFLYAMREDLADWLSSLMEAAQHLTAENFMSSIENGVVLCQHANLVQEYIEDYRKINPSGRLMKVPKRGCQYRSKGAIPGSFVARDNVANFISWCRGFGIPDVVMFESEDLVLHKNEKSVVLTLLDVARKASKFGVRPPEIVKIEEEIDMEIERDKREPERMQQRYVMERDNDLDHLVQEVINQCTCPIQFPITKVGEGKYKVGKNMTLIFVRVMRNHVMVRVGGGWDTLEHYIEKHDPCRIQDRIDSTRSPRSGQNSARTTTASEAGSDTCSVCSTDSWESNHCHTPGRTRRFSSNSMGLPDDGDEITNSLRRANTDIGPLKYNSRKSKEDSFSNKRYRTVSLETELKDCSVYDAANPSDSWLRRQLNEIKREKCQKENVAQYPMHTPKQVYANSVQGTEGPKELREKRVSRALPPESKLRRPVFTTRSLSWSLNRVESKKFHENRAAREKALQRSSDCNGSVVAKRRKSSPSHVAVNKNTKSQQRMPPSPSTRSESVDKLAQSRASDAPRPQFYKSRTMDLPTAGRSKLKPQTPRKLSQREPNQGSFKCGSSDSLSNTKKPLKSHGSQPADTPKKAATTYRKDSPSKQSQASCRGS